MAMEEDAQLLETMVKALVSKPESVKIERKVDEMGVLIELDVDKEDMGTVIGKQGRTAQALRTILRAFGARNNSRVNLKIIEPEGSERPPRKEYSADAPVAAEPTSEPTSEPASEPTAEPASEPTTEPSEPTGEPMAQ